MKYALLLYSSLLFLFGSVEKEQSKGNEESSIREASKAYENAFNKQDSEALTLLWTEDGKYINPATGEEIVGRSALKDSYDSRFAEKNKPELKINIDQISFPNKDQAIEIGKAEVKQEGEEPNETVYKAIYKRVNGKWLLDHVSEVDVLAPSTQYDHLKALEWLIGKWIDEDEDSKIETETKWDRYKNFITQKFTVYIEGIFELEGSQIIAWDPIKERFRSWIFDSNGGFGEGTWKKEGDKWVVETSFTTSEGEKGSSINIYTPIDKKSYRWESTDREVGGEMMPDITSINKLSSN